MEGKEKWLKVKEAAKVAGVSSNYISSEIRKGTLKATQISDSSRFGYHYLISETDLVFWVENRKTLGANKTATKTPSEMSIEDIAAELTIRLKKAYEDGFRDGRKAAKREISDVIKGV